MSKKLTKQNIIEEMTKAKRIEEMASTILNEIHMVEDLINRKFVQLQVTSTSDNISSTIGEKQVIFLSENNLSNELYNLLIRFEKLSSLYGTVSTILREHNKINFISIDRDLEAFGTFKWIFNSKFKKNEFKSNFAAVMLFNQTYIEKINIDFKFFNDLKKRSIDNRTWPFGEEFKKIQGLVDKQFNIKIHYISNQLKENLVTFYRLFDSNDESQLPYDVKQMIHFMFDKIEWLQEEIVKIDAVKSKVHNQEIFLKNLVNQYTEEEKQSLILGETLNLRTELITNLYTLEELRKVWSLIEQEKEAQSNQLSYIKNIDLTNLNYSNFINLNIEQVINTYTEYVKSLKPFLDSVKEFEKTIEDIARTDFEKNSNKYKYLLIKEHLGKLIAVDDQISIFIKSKFEKVEENNRKEIVSSLEKEYLLNEIELTNIFYSGTWEDIATYLELKKRDIASSNSVEIIKQEKLETERKSLKSTEEKKPFSLNELLQSEEFKQEVKDYTLVGSYKENTSMIEEYQETFNEELYENIIINNQKLVYKVAVGYTKIVEGTVLEMDDLVSYGNIGLMKALERFDPSLEFQFSTYAIYWIRQSITRNIMNTVNLVRIPVHMFEKVNKYNRIEREMLQDFGEVDEATILQELEVDSNQLKVIKEVRNQFMQITSLDTPISSDGDTTLGEFVSTESNEYVMTTLGEEYRDPYNVLKEKNAREMLLKTLDEKLSPRDAKIIKLRFGFETGKTETLQDIGKIFHVTRERIRQIEAKSLEKLKKYVEFPGGE